MRSGDAGTARQTAPAPRGRTVTEVTRVVGRKSVLAWFVFVVRSAFAGGGWLRRARRAWAPARARRQWKAPGRKTPAWCESQGAVCIRADRTRPCARSRCGLDARLDLRRRPICGEKAEGDEGVGAAGAGGDGPREDDDAFASSIRAQCLHLGEGCSIGVNGTGSRTHVLRAGLFGASERHTARLGSSNAVIAASSDGEISAVRLTAHRCWRSRIHGDRSTRSVPAGSVDTAELSRVVSCLAFANKGSVLSGSPERAWKAQGAEGASGPTDHRDPSRGEVTEA